MSANLEKLKRLLAELFQMDQADLDFGIYRIMNARRGEITRFLDQSLLPQVGEAFQHYRSADKAVLQEELDKTIEGARAAGFDPEQSPKVKELREKLAQAVDVTALENEVFSDLYNFFRRYYQEGDFLSLRRYKEGVYAIPYEGEEVKLHWANHDQYYIKTMEYFRDYAFKLPSGRRVHFKLVEADTKKDNTRAQAGNERRFMLAPEEPLTEQESELVIRFEYLPDPENRKQKELNEAVLQAAFQAPGLDDWLAELKQLWPTEKNPKRTLLEKHLTDYTARNTFDYFIHKDLGGFLRRELDFYIKNDIMHLDDIEHESAPRVEQYLSKIKVIRHIAHKIIDFLAQIEDFQKKLWLKKKFVVETNYCVTLDRVPEELYPEIAANEAQREEWIRLFSIDEIKGNLHTPKYSNPLTMEFLKANPFLMLDTKLFGQEFKDKLSGSWEDLDSQIDGVLINGDNFHALSLLKESFRNKIDCIYLDPPYNTGNDEFIYKDNYQHSSWVTFIDSRLKRMLPLTNVNTACFISIDDNEVGSLCNLIRNYSNNAKLVTFIAAQLNPRGRTLDKYLAKTHEYIGCFAIHGGGDAISEIEKGELAQSAYKYSDEYGSYRYLELRNRNPVFNRSNRPNLFFPIFVNPQNNSVSLEKSKEHTIEVLPLNSKGEEGCWTWGKEKVYANIDLLLGKKVSTGAWRIFRIDRLTKEDGAIATTKEKSIWLDKSINNENGKELVYNFFGKHVFDFPKPIALVQKCLAIGMGKDGWFIDFFAGSGTSGHSVVEQNRKDGGRRKFILVEMSDYFNTVLIPRMKKVVHSNDWKDGKPVSREGVSHMFKYLRLESYEDALNNLEFRRTAAQQRLLEEATRFRESYMLSYMLEVESQGSPSLLNLQAFEDPFNYKLNIATGSVGETRPLTVDLVETFNYLLGLTVRHIDHIRGFRVVQGVNPQGDKVLVIWRNLKEKSNQDLEEFFRKQEYNPQDLEFDLIYVNGDNNLENIRREDETWKVRLIEAEFQRLMFEVEDV